MLSFLYTAFRQPIMESAIAEQYVFRPTGSTTAALISLLHTVTQMLNTNSYVIVIAMDFSKAFDTVRHVTFLEKMANFDLPDHVFNWLVSFFTERQQCTLHSISSYYFSAASNLSQYRSGKRSWSG